MMVEEVMTNTVKDQEPHLPHVFPPETEYQLSSIFVDIPRPAVTLFLFFFPFLFYVRMPSLTPLYTQGRYGTRSISALSIKSHGEVCFYERHLEDGDSWKEHTLHFVLQNLAIV